MTAAARQAGEGARAQRQQARRQQACCCVVHGAHTCMQRRCRKGLLKRQPQQVAAEDDVYGVAVLAVHQHARVEQRPACRCAQRSGYARVKQRTCRR